MSIADANKLTTGSAVYFKDLISLEDMAATISAITPNQTVSVKVTTPGTTIIYPLSGDGTIQLPIYALN